MGLSIHYSGSFNPTASLQKMIEEVTDIVAIYQWPYHIYNNVFPESKFKADYDKHVYGVSFTPPGCETISVCFLSNGRMSCPVRLHFFGGGPQKDKELMLYTISSKTQYAGPHAHMLIINLLKYLSGKYFINFKLFDEGQYWETGNEKILQENFSRYNALLDGVSYAFQNFPMKKGESLETYFERVLKQITHK